MDINIKFNNNQYYEMDATNKFNEKESLPINNDLHQGEIVNVEKNLFTIQLLNGELIHCKENSLLKPEIGQFIKFKILSQTNDFSTIEISENNTSNKLPIIGEALKQGNLTNTPFNQKIVSFLIKNNQPIDVQTIKNMINYTKLLGTEKLNEALFLLENQIPLNQVDKDVLENIFQNKPILETDLLSLVQEINNLSDIGLKETLINLIDQKKPLPFTQKIDITLEEFKQNFITELHDHGFSENNVKNLINKGIDLLIEKNFTPTYAEHAWEEIFQVMEERIEFPLDWKDKTKNEFQLTYQEKFNFHLVKKMMLPFKNNIDNPKEYFQSLDNLMSKIVSLSNTGEKGENISKKATKIKDSLHFLTKLNTPQIIPLPLDMENLEKEIALFVHREKAKKKNEKDFQKAFISLQFKNLGLVQANIQKEHRNVSITFEVKDNMIKIVNNNLNLLHDLLKEKNYHLIHCHTNSIEKDKYFFKKQTITPKDNSSVHTFDIQT